MFQQIMLVGNLGRDPEMRYTASGVPVTSFSVAVNRRFQGQDGQWQDKTVWFRVSAWQKLAETTSQYLTKGSKVLVIGEMEEPRIWTDREGQPQASLDVRAQTVRFLSTRGETGAPGGDYQREPAGARGNTQGNDGPPELTDEDIPF